MTKKLSEIILEMAAVLLKDPVNPSSEAAHAALLFAHVAWNRANGIKVISYRKVLNEFEYSNPGLWDEFKLTTHGKITKSLVAYKNEYYPKDSRIIHICGMRKNNVHVEWAYAK